MSNTAAKLFLNQPVYCMYPTTNRLVVSVGKVMVNLLKFVAAIILFLIALFIIFCVLYGRFLHWLATSNHEWLTEELTDDELSNLIDKSLTDGSVYGNEDTIKDIVLEIQIARLNQSVDDFVERAELHCLRRDVDTAVHIYETVIPGIRDELIVLSTDQQEHEQRLEALSAKVDYEVKKIRKAEKAKATRARNKAIKQQSLTVKV